MLLNASPVGMTARELNRIRSPPQREAWKRQVLTASGLADRLAMWRVLLRTQSVFFLNHFAATRKMACVVWR